MRRAWGAALAWLLLGGCDVRPTQCRFGDELRVFEGRHGVIDAVASTLLAGRTLVALSDPTGVHLRTADTFGKTALRIGERCAGGVALAPGSDIDGVAHAWLACLRADGSTEAPSEGENAGAVTVYAVSPRLEVTERARFGRAALRSQGVALAYAGNALWVAWHDARPGERRVWHVRITSSGGALASTEPAVLSTGTGQAGPPALTVHAGRVLATWSESTLDGGGGARILLANLAQPVKAREVASSRIEAPLPVLSSDARGLVLAYRDRGTEQRQGLYAQRLRADGSALASRVRIARADGTTSAQVLPCASGLVFATPRRFGGESFVGLTYADAGLSEVSGEQQFYEDRHEFSAVSGVCERAEAVLAIAEQARAPHTGAAVRVVRARCAR